MQICILIVCNHTRQFVNGDGNEFALATLGLIVGSTLELVAHHTGLKFVAFVRTRLKLNSCQQENHNGQ